MLLDYSIIKSNRPEVFYRKAVWKNISQKYLYWSLFFSIVLQPFTSYRIDFRSVSRNYTIWCEHTFLSTLSISLKTLNIISMCFDVKNNLWKKCKWKYSNSNNKKMSKELKIDFFWTDDKIQFFLSLANSNFGCYGSKSCIINP